MTTPTYTEFINAGNKITKTINHIPHTFYMSKSPISSNEGYNVHRVLITITRGKRRFVYDRGTITDVTNGGKVDQNSYMYL